MTIPAEDLIYLGHMLEASGWALSIIEGRNEQELAHDLRLFLCLSRAIEIVGEAANHVSNSTQSRMSEVPWRQIIGMRNRLAHRYDDLNLGIIWTAAHDHIPTLMNDVRRRLPDDFAPTPLR